MIYYIAKCFEQESRVVVNYGTQQNALIESFFFSVLQHWPGVCCTACNIWSKICAAAYHHIPIQCQWSIFRESFVVCVNHWHSTSQPNKREKIDERESTTSTSTRTNVSPSFSQRTSYETVFAWFAYYQSMSIPLPFTNEHSTWEMVQVVFMSFQYENTLWKRWRYHTYERKLISCNLVVAHTIHMAQRAIPTASRSYRIMVIRSHQDPMKLFAQFLAHRLSPMASLICYFNPHSMFSWNCLRFACLRNHCVICAKYCASFEAWTCGKLFIFF